MSRPTKLCRLLLISLAATLPGCDGSDPQTPASGAPSAENNTVQVTTPDAAPAATAAKEVVSRERVLRAMTCQIELAQAVGVKMANAETGLPPELEERLKVSAITRWETFALENAQAAGLRDEDRAALVVSLNRLSSTAETRQQTIDTVRDCLDGEP